MVLVAQVFGEGAGNARIILNNQDFHGLIIGILRKPTNCDGSPEFSPGKDRFLLSTANILFLENILFMPPRGIAISWQYLSKI
jgi:hypothetical protein